MRKKIATLAVLAIITSMAPAVWAADVKDFQGTFEGNWDFYADAHHSMRGKHLSWPVVIEVTDGKAVYKEGERQELRIEAKEYPPVEGRITPEGYFAFPLRTAWKGELNIRIRKLPDGSFEAIGRESGMATKATLRKVK